MNICSDDSGVVSHTKPSHEQIMLEANANLLEQKRDELIESIHNGSISVMTVLFSCYLESLRPFEGDVIIDQSKKLLCEINSIQS